MKATIISIIIGVGLIGGAMILSNQPAGGDDSAPSVDNVSIVDGKQIIDLRAKGGYAPRRTIAKAGLPTILRLDTKGTFDCSSAVRIPSLNISRNLPPSGTTEIDLGVPKVAILEGTCSMGMYPFEIDFQS